MNIKEVFLISKETIDPKITYLKMLSNDEYQAIASRNTYYIRYLISVKDEELKILEEENIAS